MGGVDRLCRFRTCKVLVVALRVLIRQAAAFGSFLFPDPGNTLTHSPAMTLLLVLPQQGIQQVYGPGKQPSRITLFSGAQTLQPAPATCWIRALCKSRDRRICGAVWRCSLMKLSSRGVPCRTGGAGHTLMRSSSEEGLEGISRRLLLVRLHYCCRQSASGFSPLG